MDTSQFLVHRDNPHTPPHDSWLLRLSSRLSFSGKMGWLLAIVMLCTLLSNLFSAFNTRDAIRGSIDEGLIAQVQGMHSLLSNELARAPETFLTTSKALLNHSRWGENNSGYFFLADKQGRLLVYPPNASREGGFLDPVKILETGEVVNDAFARIGHQGNPELIHYPYVKPGTSTQILKAVYVIPIGDYLLMSGVYMDAADTAFISYIKHSGLTLVLTLLLLGMFVRMISKIIHSQVSRALNVLQQIAERNLSVHIQGIGSDEFSQINQALEHTRSNLSQLLLRQRDSATTLSATTTQMNNGMQQVTHAVQDQRERLDSLATSMEEMATTIRDVAYNAHQSSDDNQLTDKMAARGVKQIAASIKTIQQLFDNLATSADSVNTVERRVGEISSVVSTINSISEQTNLLALNAAIEAARAGDQGRGFAVVADEVRQLAKRTQQATHEIDLMITSLQQGTRQAVSLMNTSVEHAQLAMDDASAANAEFVAIAQQTSLQAQRGEMIASAAEEQSIVATQVTDTLMVIRDAIEVTEQVVKELEQASNSLREEAQAMESMVNSYQLAN